MHSEYVYLHCFESKGSKVTKNSLKHQVRWPYVGKHNSNFYFNSTVIYLTRTNAAIAIPSARSPSTDKLKIKLGYHNYEFYKVHA